MHVDDQLKILPGGLKRHRRTDLFDVRRQVHLERLDIEFTGFDFREIENVIDDGQQRIGARADGFRVVALRRIELGIQQQPCHADDPVHGRADLMTDIGDEPALGPVRRLRGLGCLDEHITCCALFGDVLNRSGTASPLKVFHPRRATNAIPAIFAAFGAHARLEIEDDVSLPGIANRRLGNRSVVRMNQAEQRTFAVR